MDLANFGSRRLGVVQSKVLLDDSDAAALLRVHDVRTTYTPWSASTPIESARDTLSRAEFRLQHSFETTLSQAATLSPDGTLLAAGDGTTVRLWDPGAGTHLRSFSTHTESIKALAFNRRGTLLASGADDHTVHLWNPQAGTHVRALSVPGPVEALAFSENGRLLAAACTRSRWNIGGVCVWNTTTWARVSYLEDVGDSYSLAFGADDSIFAHGAYEKVLCRDLYTRKRLSELDIDIDRNLGLARRYRYTYSNRYVRSIAFHPSGTSMAYTCDKSVHVCNPTNGTYLYTLADHENTVNAIAFSHDGTILASAEYEAVHFWDSATQEQVGTLAGLDGDIHSLEFNGDSSVVVTAHRRATQVWRLR